MRGGGAGIVQQALYRRLAVGVMGIAFLLKDYQIATMRGIAAAIYSLFFFWRETHYRRE